MYYTLKSANYKSTPNINENDFWTAFCNFYSSKSIMNTSYKYGLFKALLDNIYNIDDNFILTYEQIFSKFVEIYWNLIRNHKLIQQVKTKKSNTGLFAKSNIEQIIDYISQKYNLPTTETIYFENISQEAKKEATNLAIRKCSTYVVGSLFGDTKELLYSFITQKSDFEKLCQHNKLIKKQYEEKGLLQFNPLAYDFIIKHKLILEKINYFEWAKFLEKVNSDNILIRVLDKLDSSTQRHDLSYYRYILFEEFEQNYCFYCHKPLIKLSNEQYAVDHFIPWSFIKDDKIWNFVLSCRSCNSSKSDKLANRDFLEKIKIRNSQILLTHFNKVNGELKTYNNSRLDNLYNSAFDNGFTNIWNGRNL